MEERRSRKVEEQRLRKIEASVDDLVRFVRAGLLALFLATAFTFAFLGYGVLKVAEFWAVDSRNFKATIERLERYHAD